MGLNDFFAIGLSLVAILISILVFRYNLRSDKRQLRIEKIEEMLEIIHILSGNYEYFEDTYFFKLRIEEENMDKNIIEKYRLQTNELEKISLEIDLRNKLTRLYILNNSYLPKLNLKEKIGVFISVYTSLVEVVLNKPKNIEHLPFSKFPRRWHFLEFTQEIQNELIAEMGLGYSENISNNNLYENKFKERYNLK